MRDAGRRRLGLLAAMVALQVGWLAVRSRVVGNPLGTPEWGVAWASIGAGVVVALLPAAWIDALERALARIAADARRAALVVGGVALAVAAAAAWVQQPLGWDEPLVLNAARIVADEGLPAFFARYASIPWLGTNHPPLVVVLYGLAMRAVGPDLLALRLLTALVGAATVVVCLAIARRLVAPEASLLAALVLLTSPLFDRMASSAMNDAFVTFFFVLALWLVLARTRSGVLLGVAVGVGTLCKYTMLLAYPVLAAVAAIDGQLRARRRTWLVAAGVSLALFVAWLAIAAHLDVFSQQRTWVTRVAGVATRSWKGFGYTLDAIFTKLPSGIGIYNVPAVALGLAGAAALGRRTRRVLLAWVALVALPLLLTMPDNRYFLPAYPAIAIVAGHGLARMGRGRGRVLLLAALLCAATLAYYAAVDLRTPAFPFRKLLGAR